MKGIDSLYTSLHPDLSSFKTHTLCASSGVYSSQISLLSSLDLKNFISPQDFTTVRHDPSE